MKKNKNQNSKGFSMPDEITSSASVQSSNVSTPDVAPASPVISTKVITPTVQAKKARLPMEVTLLPMETEVRPRHS